MPLQRSFSCAVLHFLQFMVAVSRAAESAGILAGASHRQLHAHTGQLVRQAMTGHGTRGLLATSPQPYTVHAVYSPVPRVATALPYGHYGGGGLKAGYSGGYAPAYGAQAPAGGYTLFGAQPTVYFNKRRLLAYGPQTGGSSVGSYAAYAPAAYAPAAYGPAAYAPDSATLAAPIPVAALSQVLANPAAGPVARSFAAAASSVGAAAVGAGAAVAATGDSGPVLPVQSAAQLAALNAIAARTGSHVLGTAAFFQPAPAPGPAPGPAPAAAVGAPLAAPAGAGAPAGGLPAVAGPAPLPAAQPGLQLAAVPATQFAAIAAALHLSAHGASAAAAALAASAAAQEAAADQLDALLAAAAAAPVTECGLVAVPPNLTSALTVGPLGSLQGQNGSETLLAAAAALAGLPADLFVVPAPPPEQQPTAPAPGPQPASTAPAPGPTSSFPAAVLAPDNAPHPQGAPAVPTLQQIADKYAAASKP